MLLGIGGATTATNTFAALPSLKLSELVAKSHRWP